VEPGIGAPWRDSQIEDAKLRYGNHLTAAITAFLIRTDVDLAGRIGALRLAGHVASEELLSAIETCWNMDESRGEHLGDYLWAIAECLGRDCSQYLVPVCDAWAALPPSSDNDRSSSSPTRDNLTAHSLRFAFRRWPPREAIDYFVQRGAKDDLTWPITYMLHGIDDPKAISFVVHQLAAMQSNVKGTDGCVPFVLSAPDEWRRAQDDLGRPMSKASRNVLLQLWQCETNDDDLRAQAFRLWAATRAPDDTAILRAARPSVGLADRILKARLVRGDQEAIPAMVEKVATDDSGRWWFCGRHIWSPKLTVALDAFLERRGHHAKREWGENCESDHITYELIMALPEGKAERLLLKHWDHLRFTSIFVQTALYLCTPRLLAVAHDSIRECPIPRMLMQYLNWRFGLNTTGHPGLTREAQILALEPFLDLISGFDIQMLWDACNEHGWFDTRRRLLDARLEDAHELPRHDREGIALELDQMVSENRTVWIGYWVDRILGHGISWGDLLGSMTDWLEKRHTFQALCLVVDAIQQRGNRENLRALKSCEDLPGKTAGQMIADARFAVFRRSLR
jgi:hypothetical protein